MSEQNIKSLGVLSDFVNFNCGKFAVGILGDDEQQIMGTEGLVKFYINDIIPNGDCTVVDTYIEEIVIKSGNGILYEILAV